MSDQKLKWYEINIGWNDEKSWFLVDVMTPERGAYFGEAFTGKKLIPRRESVEVKTVEGSTSEIIIQAKFSSMPTLEDAMAVVLSQTHMDLSGEVKYHLTSRADGLASHVRSRLADKERERMRGCVPAEDINRHGISVEGDGGAP